MTKSIFFPAVKFLLPTQSSGTHFQANLPAKALSSASCRPKHCRLAPDTFVLKDDARKRGKSSTIGNCDPRMEHSNPLVSITLKEGFNA